ncbi:CPBP family intramembrane glutamic endopeptidase, BDIM_20840 family [Solimonas marina]|uniref:CPBP family intramembrane metalloprotease n=1 Tax=Solimonas marina TaxID=2714601 RepID=A0A969W775_9GAMM|nr:CPBP family intramembrane glutamic endopeptidase [Solimonas marina]NKF20748.1 CPBP family intramembrane metalloprotease [Solimonas marina]
MNAVIGMTGVVGLLLLAGFALGLTQRRHFSPRWLLIAATLVLVNDFLLTRGYGLLPHLLPPSEWNWQGKLLALAATLCIAALPGFGWRRSGLTVTQTPGSLKSCVPVALLYCAFFAVIAWIYPSGPASHETVAFQLTMPGFEEEPFYRGILLLALDQAFRGRVRFLSVDWGWGAVLSCALFGLAHAFGYGAHGFSCGPMTMALTALPSFIAVWLRLRTGSVLLPIVLHNFGNSISLLI